MKALKAIDFGWLGFSVLMVLGLSGVTHAYASEGPDAETLAMVGDLLAMAWGFVPSAAQPWVLGVAGISWACSWFVDPLVKDETISKWSPWLRVPFDLVTGRVLKAKRFK